jgi:hypothetical protein
MWEMDYSYQQCHLKHITIITCGSQSLESRLCTWSFCYTYMFSNGNMCLQPMCYCSLQNINKLKACLISILNGSRVFALLLLYKVDYVLVREILLM